MIEIDEALVAGLVADQFPRWSGLPVRAVPRQGWDNRTFRLGDELCARLPSADGYAAAVAKEERALRFLAGRLDVAVPEVLAIGAPADGYPLPWSVRRWLPGTTMDTAAGADQIALARDLGAVLTTLRSLPTGAGRAAGRHSFYRGCHPGAYGDEVQVALELLRDEIDAAACAEIWLRATTSVWTSAPVWFHGDVAVGNLLVERGRLSALIDFGTCGVGDPASDLAIAWTHFTGDARTAFREAAGLDDATWRRARGWALWKALATLSGQSSPDAEGAQRRILAEVLADPLV
ncbi:aminoglycoside phosphotransferase family protein [Microbacterium rhizophilus]|uniref:aminoglycoside phosphotransferase family protein n=1 Tax=Microbacterium rhizophilus TaxID=3138934 RepID=UPI0031E5AEAC